eukprot:718369_1
MILLLLSILLVSLKGETYDLGTSSYTAWTKHGEEYFGNFALSYDASGCSNDSCIFIFGTDQRGVAYIEQEVDLSGMLYPTLNFAVTTVGMDGDYEYAFFKYKCKNDVIFDTTEINRGVYVETDYSNSIDLDVECHVVTVQIGGNIGATWYPEPQTRDDIYIKQVEIDYTCGVCSTANSDSISNINSQIGDLNARIDALVEQLNVIPAAHTNGINGFDYNNLGGIDTDKYTLSNLIMVGLVAVAMTAFICQCMYWNFAKRSV